MSWNSSAAVRKLPHGTSGIRAPQNDVSTTEKPEKPHRFYLSCPIREAIGKALRRLHQAEGPKWERSFNEGALPCEVAQAVTIMPSTVRRAGAQLSGERRWVN